MPVFHVEDLDIELMDFVESCSTLERMELVNILAEMGHTYTFSESRGSSLEAEHKEKCNLLAAKFYSMTKEDLETLQTLYIKYA